MKQQVSGGCLAAEFGFLDDVTIAVPRKDAELISPSRPSSALDLGRGW
jgi:hypothetical protein